MLENQQLIILSSSFRLWIRAFAEGFTHLNVANHIVSFLYNALDILLPRLALPGDDVMTLYPVVNERRVSQAAAGIYIFISGH